ncbi:MAG: Na/Pi cotransporter family protein [Bacilli bacterium]|nr:Na/Pi cotransporter family protein [Bacilli bacterium]
MNFTNVSLAEAIIYLLIGIAVFLVGMNLMSGGLRKATGKKLKNFFKKTRNNPFAGMAIGTAFTSIIQSSDATAAMVIGFINAGAMTIFQGISIILGAYIGTTVTGLIVSFSSLNFSLYLLLFAFIGIVLSFFKNELVKNIGEILAGLGLLFFGLAVMKGTFSQVNIHDFCLKLFSNAGSPILLFLIGIVIAALAQSSSACTGIVIAMVGAGSLSLQSGLCVVLGATIGSVTNTLLVSAQGKTDGKRTAWMCFAMRTLTSLIALLIVYLAGSYISQGFKYVFKTNELAVAMFLVAYNIIFMPLLIPLIKPLEKLFNKIIKDKSKKSIESAVKYIDDNLIKTPEIALMQTKKEIVNMITLAEENYERAYQRVKDQLTTNDALIIETEDKIDYLNQRITDYLINVSGVAQTRDEKKVGAYFHVINDIERIGDHAYNYYEMSNNMANESLKFSAHAIEELDEMHNTLRKMFAVAKEIFYTKHRDKLVELDNLENEIDRLKEEYSSNHYSRITQNLCSVELTPFYSGIVSEIERVADHLVNIAYSINNPTGDDN